jgi:hypothetical protein
MKRSIQLGVIVGVALAASVPWSGARADDEAASTRDDAGTVTVQQPAPAPEGAKVGAGSMEPAELIDEEPGTAVHRAWVQSIWTSP